MITIFFPTHTSNILYRIVHIAMKNDTEYLQDNMKRKQLLSILGPNDFFLVLKYYSDNIHLLWLKPRLIMQNSDD